MNKARISELRRARGWTQERLADAAGVAVRTIQRLESGSDASPETLALIAGALQVPVSDLFAHVETTQFQAAIDELDARKRAQQQHRDALTQGAVLVFRGVGLVVTLATIATTMTGVLPWWGWFVLPAYWAGGSLILQATFRFLIDPHLDSRFPLSATSLNLTTWSGVEQR
ncbi:hypothetical protein LLS1_31680 [Leifsonia sp. LS1]|uniref:helix-turn-helix domain-containing protein n=1 Tax=Leifsonia sp. LS1 TaxID=2828483 RepID=UPI001CFD0996|nr:helix-turn-helix transcriptional regulator [Leifsonia sp. LS1]GIT81499.1 hypothetical protein LLS1_31680 [Leifsonia sp. LS1]